MSIDKNELIDKVIKTSDSYGLLYVDQVIQIIQGLDPEKTEWYNEIATEFIKEIESRIKTQTDYKFISGMYEAMDIITEMKK
jgi:hypothetical protein